MLHTALLMSGAEGGGWTNLIFFGAILLIFYFFIIRPQSKRQKELEELRDNLQKGDKIVTSGGIIAKVTTVDEDTVLAEIDQNVKARFKKNSITDVNPNQD